MNWYITRLVHQIICGKGQHTAQFDEQIRLIAAANEDEAFAKATEMGLAEQEVFCNEKSELVQWKFINVTELYQLRDLTDGAEIYSRITEVEDAVSYVHAVHQRAISLQEKSTRRLLHLI
jgi:hypothetical protein